MYAKIEVLKKPEALKSLYRSPGYKKNQLVLCKNYESLLLCFTRYKFVMFQAKVTKYLW